MSLALIRKEGSSSFIDVDTVNIFRSTQAHPAEWLYSTYANRIRSFSSSSYVGWKTPNFRTRVRRGELIPHTPWFKEKKSGSCYGIYDIVSGSSTWTRDRGAPYFWYGDNTVWILPDNYIIGQVPVSGLTDLVQEASAKIYDSGWDALTFLAEFAEVPRMFASLAKRALRPSLWPKGIDFRKVSCEWMSMRYGWRTLIYDLLEINQMLRSYNKKRKSRLAECRRKMDTWQTSSTVIDTPLPGIMKRHKTTLETWEVSKVGSVAADIEIPAIQANLFVTAWELIPFSFVIDWFLSVGKAISAASFLCLQTNYVASYGFQVKCTRTFTATPEWLEYYRSGTYSFTGCSESIIEHRVPCRVPLLPHLTVRLDAAKIIDLVAMIVQRKGR